MILLLIIADDFTGALDTGVQFALHGIRTRVVVDPDVDFTAQEAGVLVVDAETRHLPAGEAYETVAGLTRRARCAGVSYIYKKTDSALRGNIGAELAALLNASGRRQLPFLPAFPQTGRVTRGGVHYVDGVPVTDSPFGTDPFEPVTHAVVTKLIAQQCDLPARCFPALREGDSVPLDEGILVFDAADAGDLSRTGRLLLEQGALHIMAGCAGFAAVLPGLLGMAAEVSPALPELDPRLLGMAAEVSPALPELDPRLLGMAAEVSPALPELDPRLLGMAAEASPALPELDPRLLVVCGSVNPITLAQLDHAEQAGFTRLRLTPRQKLEPDYWQSGEGRADLVRIGEMLTAGPRCIIETNDPGGNQATADYADRLGIDRETLRVRIAGSLGRLVGRIFTSPGLGTLLLTGGDTLLHCMESLGVRELEPLCELEKGVVLARFTYNGCTRHVITKSGGFGQESLLADLAADMARNH